MIFAQNKIILVLLVVYVVILSKMIHKLLTTVNISILVYLVHLHISLFKFELHNTLNMSSVREHIYRLNLLNLIITVLVQII